MEALTGSVRAYKLLPWVHAALRKLELGHKSSPEKGGASRSPRSPASRTVRAGRWVYAVNGVASPYQLNTQTIEDVKRIAFSYR